LNPIDRYIVGLRSTPAKPGDTLFEIKTVSLSTLKGKVVTVTILTAFFFVNKQAHLFNEAGKG
jgi:hypothetical protein